MLAANATNAIIVVAAFAALVGFAYLWRLTQARGFALKALACVWALIARSLLVAGVEPFATYSAPLILPFWLLMVAGVWCTAHKLHGVYAKVHRDLS
jgi:hypothetical protein